MSYIYLIKIPNLILFNSYIILWICCVIIIVLKCFKLSVSPVGTCAPEDTPGKLSQDNIEIEFMMRTK